MNVPPDKQISQPELRLCPLTGQGVLVAPGRAVRPMTAVDANAHHRPPRHRVNEGVFCPFCVGNEWDTPNETYAIYDQQQAWQLRVVPNKFPAIDESGVHEVVIPCRLHETNPCQLTDNQLTAMIFAWRSRLQAFAKQPHLQHATVFMNVGAEAGASLDHLHCQILATPFVPDLIQRELHGYQKHAKCFFCEQHRLPQNLVYETEQFFVHCPHVSRFAYETWIIPKMHQARFELSSDDSIPELASLLKQALLAIDQQLHEPAYNIYIHTAPFNTNQPFHWHIEIIPRIARAAGFEWGAGVFINIADPVQCAKQLRSRMRNKGI